MKKIFVLSLMFLLSLAVLTTSFAEVPHLVSYQGRLTDNDGKPLDGVTKDVTFRIFDALTAGNKLWEEVHRGVLVQQGIFNVYLGSVIALNIAFDKPYYLEIMVENEVLTPRQQITSAGFAIKAEKAEIAENALKVNNIEANITAQPNKLLPLDNNAKLPISALKVYDSGWFAVSASSSYSLVHNLGTTKCIVTVLVSQNSNGTGNTSIAMPGVEYNPYNTNGGIYVTGLTITNIALRTAISCVGTWNDSSGTSVWLASGYCRVLMLGLE